MRGARHAANPSSLGGAEISAGLGCCLLRYRYNKSRWLLRPKSLQITRASLVDFSRQQALADEIGVVVSLSSIRRSRPFSLWLEGQRLDSPSLAEMVSSWFTSPPSRMISLDRWAEPQPR